MGSTKHETMVEAVEISIAEALKDKRIDKKKHAAMIQAVRELAARADIGDIKDNVTFPTLLKYLVALGLTPDEITETKKPPKKNATTNERMVKKFKNYGGVNA